MRTYTASQEDQSGVDLNGYLESLRQRIDTALTYNIPVLFDGSSTDLQKAVQRSLADGKRIRACLVCLICEALGGRIDDAMHRALAIECVHAASLLHDDFVDADRTRREQPAEWTVAGARRAVLLADVMFATAIADMVKLGTRDGAIIAGAISDMARGAYEEFYWREDTSGDSRCWEQPTQPDPYDALIAGKTGSLFGAAAELGASAAQAPVQLTARAYAFGALLGDAYQIADDRADLRSVGLAHNRLPLPMAVIRHFGRAALEEALLAAVPLTTPAEGGPPCALPTLDRAMAQAITERVKRAQAALDSFPPNRFTQFLRELPSHCLPPSCAEEL